MTANLTYHSQLTPEQITKAKRQYSIQKRDAIKYRGIGFELTFEDWIAIWLDSGKWEHRGHNSGQYCMSRVGDKGPYALGNVFIQLHSENAKQSTMRDSWLMSVREATKQRDITAPDWKMNIKDGITEKYKDPSYKEKHAAACRTALRKPYHTPQGDFESVGAAIEASGLSPITFRRRAKANPAEYYPL